MSIESPTSPGRRERKHQQTLDHLANTAWALFEAEGFEAVTMEAIASAADVAKGTLYKHFAAKEALLAYRLRRELAEEMATGIAALMALPDTETRLRAFLRRSAGWTIRHRTHMAAYLRHRLGEFPVGSGHGSQQRSGMDRALDQLIASGLAQGDLHKGQDAARLTQLLQSLYLATVLRWLAAPSLDLADEFDAMVNLFMDGARAR